MSSNGVVAVGESLYTKVRSEICRARRKLTTYLVNPSAYRVDTHTIGKDARGCTR